MIIPCYNFIKLTEGIEENDNTIGGRHAWAIPHPATRRAGARQPPVMYPVRNGRSTLEFNPSDDFGHKGFFDPERPVRAHLEAAIATDALVVIKGNSALAGDDGFGRAVLPAFPAEPARFCA